LREICGSQVEALFLIIGALVVCLLRSGKSLALVPVAAPLLMLVSIAILITLGLGVTYGCSLLNSRESEECRDCCGPHDDTVKLY